MTKTEQQLREKLDEMLAFDASKEADPRMMFSKAAACKTLLWALGENDDDRWLIRATPGPPELCDGETNAAMDRLRILQAKVNRQ